MSSLQHSFEVSTPGRGFTEITTDVARRVRSAAAAQGHGIAHVFARHTSCSIIITENADPSVLLDLERMAARWAPDGDSDYVHDAEGPEDMAAHGRSVQAGSSVSVPIGDGQLLLGSWQGIFLWEHRARPHVRTIVVTIVA